MVRELASDRCAFYCLFHCIAFPGGSCQTARVPVVIPAVAQMAGDLCCFRCAFSETVSDLICLKGDIAIIPRPSGSTQTATDWAPKASGLKLPPVL